MKKSVFMFYTILFALFGCNKDNTPQELDEQKEIIISELDKIDELSEFNSELAKVDLSGIDGNALTVFAVSNASMPKSSLIKSSTGWEDFDITRHIVVGAYTREQLTDGLMLHAVSGDELYISVIDDDIYINGVLLGDVLTAGNSLTYILSLPIPSSGGDGTKGLAKIYGKFGDSQKVPIVIFEYDSKNRIIKETRYRYRYNYDDVTELSNHYDIEYTYDDSGNSIETKGGPHESYNNYSYSLDGNEVTGYKTIELNNNGLPIKAGFDDEWTETYGYDSKNNVNKYTDSEFGWTSTITYNDKNGPLSTCKTPQWYNIAVNMIDEEYWINNKSYIVYYPYYLGIKNNPVRMVEDYGGGDKDTYNYSYEYTSAGYPRVCTVTGTFEKRSISYIMYFEYNK